MLKKTHKTPAEQDHISPTNSRSIQQCNLWTEADETGPLNVRFGPSPKSLNSEIDPTTRQPQRVPWSIRGLLLRV